MSGDTTQVMYFRHTSYTVRFARKIKRAHERVLTREWHQVKYSNRQPHEWEGTQKENGF